MGRVFIISTMTVLMRENYKIFRPVKPKTNQLEETSRTLIDIATEYWCIPLNTKETVTFTVRE
jgi:hypothetical protein